MPASPPEKSKLGDRQDVVSVDANAIANAPSVTLSSTVLETEMAQRNICFEPITTEMAWPPANDSLGRVRSLSEPKFVRLVTMLSVHWFV